METIQELNTKWWYRALKVVYTILFLLSFGTAVIASLVTYTFIKENIQTYENEVIENTERMEFIQEMKKKGYTFEQMIESFSEKYDMQGRLLYLNSAEFEAIYDESLDKRGSNIILESESKRPDFPASTSLLLIFIPLYFLLAWIITEAPKRIFYYVVLGKVYPNKP